MVHHRKNPNFIYASTFLKRTVLTPISFNTFKNNLHTFIDLNGDSRLVVRVSGEGLSLLGRNSGIPFD